MRLPEGATSVSSPTGIFCSLVLLVILIGYGVQKISILIGKRDIDINIFDVPLYFDNDESFGYENGFNVAVAIQDLGINGLIDARYGMLKAEIKTI